MSNNYTFHSERWPQLGGMLEGKLSEGVAPFIAAVLEKPDLALRLAKSSAIFYRKKMKRDAVLLANAALSLAPSDPKIKVITDWLNRDQAPLWHFGIIQDDRRNKVYSDALNHHVKPGMTVFEIGTGTGILAMLAVRAGARHVYTCERRADVAAAAREIVALNGMSSQITVIAKDAYALQLGVDMPERADLFVAEIVDNGLLTEDVLPLTELARKKFLKPDAILLPMRIAARGCLISVSDRPAYRLDSVMGFDMRPFNRFTPAQVSAGKGGGDHFLPLSPAKELISFDLREDALKEGVNTVALKAEKQGLVDSLMHWLFLDFGDDIVFENAPPQDSAWFPNLHILPAPIDVEIGDSVIFDVEHIHTEMFVNLSES
jgi:hypothetical protein